MTIGCPGGHSIAHNRKNPMTHIGTKIAAAACIAALALSTSACGDSTIDVDEFDKEDITKAFDGKTFAGEEINLAPIGAEELGKLITEQEETMEKVSSYPEECAPYISNPMYRMDPDDDPENTLIFISNQDSPKVDSVLYNVDPSDDLVDSLEELFTLRDKCDSFGFSILGDENKLGFDKLDAHGKGIMTIESIEEYGDVATRAVKSQLKLIVKGEDNTVSPWNYQLLLNNGQYLYIVGDKEADVKKATDQALSYMGVELDE